MTLSLGAHRQVPHTWRSIIADWRNALLTTYNKDSTVRAIVTRASMWAQWQDGRNVGPLDEPTAEDVRVFADAVWTECNQSALRVLSACANLYEWLAPSLRGHGWVNDNPFAPARISPYRILLREMWRVPDVVLAPDRVAPFVRQASIIAESEVSAQRFEIWIRLIAAGVRINELAEFRVDQAARSRTSDRGYLLLPAGRIQIRDHAKSFFSAWTAGTDSLGPQDLVTRFGNVTLTANALREALSPFLLVHAPVDARFNAATVPVEPGISRTYISAMTAFTETERT